MVNKHPSCGNWWMLVSVTDKETIARARFNIETRDTFKTSKSLCQLGKWTYKSGGQKNRIGWKKNFESYLHKESD